MTVPLGLTAVRLVALTQAAGEAGLIHVAAGERRADQLAATVRAFAPELTVAVLPPWDCLPYDHASPSREIMGRRLAALRLLASTEGPRLLITTPEASAQRLPPPEVADIALHLNVGDAVDLATLEAFAPRAGYVAEEIVDEPGEFAVRGQVVEIFPAHSARPYRLELDEGRISAIRAFDVLTQRSIEDAEQLILIAASEVVLAEDADPAERRPGLEHAAPVFHPDQRTIFNILPKAHFTEEALAEGRRHAFQQQVAEAYADRARPSVSAVEHAAPLPPERLYLTDAEWSTAVEERTRKADPSAGEGGGVPRFVSERNARRALATFVREQAAAGRRILLTSVSDRDRRTLSREVERVLDRAPRAASDWAAVLDAAPGEVLTLDIALDAGFVDEAAGVVVIAAADLLGGRASLGQTQAATATGLPAPAELRAGDLVVHMDHGLGRLDGLERIAAGGEPRDTVTVGYDADARLLVCVEEIGSLWRYGAEAGALSLDRVDGEGWNRRRAKILGEIAQTARHLVELAEARAKAVAPKLVPPRADYDRFSARFPFTETPDQLRAIEDTLADLALGRPLDRLVIADVGFGKTEVALRAAAAAVLAGKQAAIVAPTTVLARQHVETFRRRFAGFTVDGAPIEVGHLSRLVTPAEAKATKAALADGSVRLVVGTHAVAGKGVEFHDLGLMVIDEEQRFGSAQKTKLREMGENTHVLTLTATPIPRTLQAAMVGLQELSVINTPPARRRPIRTVSSPFDAPSIRAALLREKRRGGQSFVVVPRIEDMEPMATRLADLIPELTTFAAHGKMPAAEVDETMVRFASGEGDVLLATNIIESGLDVPRANTMVIWRPDRFGLAQLHQLRGRVGRGRLQGVCHLVTEPDAEVSEATAKRLGALEAHDRLGAGLAISAQDLDIRGAGDLMGDEQAGHMKLIGVELYQHLLGLALREARGETVEDWGPELKLDALGEIPDDYVPESDLRLNLYARLAKVADAAEVDALAEEIDDRFGEPPPRLLDLLALARIRAACRTLNVARVDAGPQAIALTFRHRDEAEATIADTVAANAKLAWKGERLIYAEPTDTPQARLERISSLLDDLS